MSQHVCGASKGKPQKILALSRVPEECSNRAKSDMLVYISFCWVSVFVSVHNRKIIKMSESIAFLRKLAVDIFNCICEMI